MTDQPTPSRSANAGMPRTSSPWLVWSLVLPFGAMWIADPVSAEQLVMGWLYFPIESLPRMTIEWPVVLLTAVVLPLFVAILTTPIARRGILWPARQARRITAILLLVFVAGTAMVGLGHQLIWLTQGTGPKGERTILMTVFSPILAARDAARRSQGKNALKWLALAAHNRESAYRHFSPGGTITPDGRPLHGWLTFLGPFSTLSTYGVDFDVSWNEEPNARLFRCQVHEVVHPSMSELFDRNGYGLSHFAANVRAMPIRVRAPSLGKGHSSRAEHGLAPADFRDGTNNTILFGQVVDNLQPWGSPRNVRDPALGLGHPYGFGALPHEPGALVAMADGAVRTLSTNIDPAVMRALATPDGGEAVPSFND